MSELGKRLAHRNRNALDNPEPKGASAVRPEEAQQAGVALPAEELSAGTQADDVDDTAGPDSNEEVFEGETPPLCINHDSPELAPDSSDPERLPPDAWRTATPTRGRLRSARR